MKEVRQEILNHWQEKGNLELVRDNLNRRGLTLELASVEALAAWDQLHVGTIESNRAFCDWLKMPTCVSVLDLGGGTGGPARFLADHYQCDVVAIDLSPELVDAGRQISQAMGLGDRVEHLVGDAQDLHLNRKFDFIWIQHLDMQVPTKIALYQTAARCLKPSGRVVWHDWLQGEGTVRYPVMWSENGSISFLSDEESFRKNTANAGLTIEKMKNIRSETTGWLHQTAKKLTQALERLEQSAPSTSGRQDTLRLLEQQINNTLENVTQQSLIPIFASATASNRLD